MQCTTEAGPVAEREATELSLPTMSSHVRAETAGLSMPPRSTASDVPMHADAVRKYGYKLSVLMPAPMNIAVSNSAFLTLPSAALEDGVMALWTADSSRECSPVPRSDQRACPPAGYAAGPA